MFVLAGLGPAARVLGAGDHADHQDPGLHPDEAGKGQSQTTQEHARQLEHIL